MKKLDFLCVGAQKSGTSALYHYLSLHQDIQMPKQKELHFFDNEKYFVRNDIRYDVYHSHFDFGDDRLKGEITPIYMYWDDAIKRIWRYNPYIKIIVLLRNPIKRAYSHWNMESYRGAENLDFFEAIKTEEMRGKEALPHKHRVYSYKDRGFYSEQLRNIYRFFPKNQVLVLRYDKFKQNTLESLNAITSFLGISNFDDITKKIIHATPYDRKMTYEEFVYLKDSYIYEIKTIEKMLDWDCSQWLEWEDK